jgi:CheY-like chemotaxis protein
LPISKALPGRGFGMSHAVNQQPRLLCFFLVPPLAQGFAGRIGGNVAEKPIANQGWNGMKKPPGRETAFNVVLSVSPKHEDCASLERIFKSGWTVIASATVASALSVLREMPIPIVICDCDTTPGTWGEMLDHISLLPDPPLLIVTSRLADERLWAEALNLGAWDVLAKPFDTSEVIRVAGVAGQHWRDLHGIYGSCTKQRKPATGHMAATGT